MWRALNKYVWDLEGEKNAIIASCNDKADAKLVAQAPELLEVAEMMLTECQITRAGMAQSIVDNGAGPHAVGLLQELDDLIERTIKAISKAKGEDDQDQRQH